MRAKTRMMKLMGVSLLGWLLMAIAGLAQPYMAVNGANGDYLTLNYYIDEPGDSESVEIDLYPNVGGVTKAEVWSNLNRRDYATLDASDAASDPGPAPGSDSYWVAHPMTDAGGGKWTVTLPVNKTGAYRLTTRFKTSGSSDWQWYQGRNTAVMVSPKKSRDVILYELQVNVINATGDDFASRSTFEDLHDSTKPANLDHFEALGVNTLWIQPIHPIGNHPCINVDGPGSPYSIQNMWEVAPFHSRGNTRESSMTAFTNFAAAAKARNIDFFFDIIFNHTSWDAEIGQDPDDPTQPAANPAALIKDILPQWYSRYSSTDLPCGEFDYNQGSFQFWLPARNASEIGPAPAERNDFGKWPDVADLFWGDYSSLSNPQSEADGPWIIDQPGADVRRMAEYFAYFGIYWIEKSGGTLGGFRCDYAQGIPPQAWEFIVNKTRQVKWDFIFMAESLDGGPVSRRAGRHMDIINQNWVWQVLENGGNTTGFRGIIDGNKTDYGFAGIMRGLINHDQNAPADVWYSFSRYAVGAAVDGAPQMYQGQELGYRNNYGFSQFRNQFDRWIPHIFKWHNMQTLWNNRDAVLERAYQRVNNARMMNPAFRVHDQWYLDQQNGGPHQEIFSVLKYDKFGWDPAHQNVVLSFVNLTPWQQQQGTFNLGAVQAIYLDPGREYNLRNLTSDNPGANVWGTPRTGADLSANGIFVDMGNNEAGLVQFFTLVAQDGGGGGGGSIAINSVSTWPAQGDITSTDDIWIDVWTSPIEVGQEVNLVYSNSVTKNWQVVPMAWAEHDEGQNRTHWNYNLGTFPPESVIQFAVEAIPAGGGDSVWDSNNGADYIRTVNAGGGGGGECNPDNNVEWAGEGSFSPAEPTAAEDFMIEVKSWPIAPDQYAEAVFCFGECESPEAWATVDMYWIRNDFFVWTNEVSQVGTNANSVWGYNFGQLSAGTEITFAMVVKDSCDNELWDSNGGVNFNAVIGGGGDSNTNGIPDEWEMQWFGQLVSGNGDWDDDGVSDKDEYEAGTNPTDENDFLHVMALGMSTNGNDRAAIRWSGVPQRSYKVLVSRDGVAGPYTNELAVRSTVGQSSHMISVEDPQSENYPASYYRLELITGGGGGGGGGGGVTNETVSVSATPGSTTFTNEAGISITLNVVGDNVVTSTYMVEGAAAVAFTNGEVIVFGADLDPGQSRTLTLFGQTEQGVNDQNVYLYTRGGGMPMTHVSGTHHFVSDENDVWINTAGYPEGASVQAYIVYCINPPCAGDWPLIAMNRNTDWENGDWWNINLGIQPDGTVIQFAVMMVDGEGTEHWDSNNGQNYTVTIGGGGGGGGGGVGGSGFEPYSTNPTKGSRVANGSITINGTPGGAWTDANLIALDMANDDPRTLGSNWTTHEAPIDLTHLWSSWDDNFLYVAWQYVDVTDVIDPSNAGSAGGSKISNTDGVLQWIVIDTIPGQGATNDVWGKLNTWAGANKPNYQIYLAGSLWQGFISREVDGEFALDDGGVNYMSIAAAGIEVAKGDTYAGGSALWGVGDADDRFNADAPNRNFLAEGHNTARDSFYEMKIPLSFLGVTAAQIEANGIGIMVGAGSESSMDSIPHDETTLDTQGVEVWNSSLEWGDEDVFTAPFARIGN